MERVMVRFMGTSGSESLSAATIATFALCGFANLSSIGITVGGISAIASSHQKDLAHMGFKAIVAGSLTCFMTAAIAGILL